MQNIPLAERLRPISLSDVIGQKQLIGKESPLYKQIKQKIIPSIIFWGPPANAGYKAFGFEPQPRHLRYKKVVCIFILIFPIFFKA